MKLSVRSVTDIITNSSSESFLIRTYGKTISDIYDELLALNDDGYSGVGGDLSVMNCTGVVGTDKNWYKDLPKDFAIVDTDQDKKKVIEFLFRNYFVIDLDEGIRSQARDSRTGRIVGYGYIYEENPQPGVIIETNCGKIINLFDLWGIYESDREALKDESALLKRTREYYKHLEKTDPDYCKSFKESCGDTPEEYVLRMKDQTEKFFKNNKQNPAITYGYKY